MNVNIICLVALLPIVLEPPVQPEVIEIDGGGAARSQILADPKKILSRASFSAGQVRLIFVTVNVVAELLLILHFALFVSVIKLLSEIDSQGEVVVLVGEG